MEWQVARHPLLERHLKSLNRELVPLTLKLNKEQRLLIISGPNAGGKSIALKTFKMLNLILRYKRENNGYLISSICSSADWQCL